jgi:hypothetical protein
MKDSDGRALPHVPEASLIKAIDDELPASESAEIERHLCVCEDCRRRYQSLQQLSSALESAVAASPVGLFREQRARLEVELDSMPIAAPPREHKTRRLALGTAAGLAVAAAAACALLVAPQWKRSVDNSGSRGGIQPSVFEVDGERFVALPYSNPDLPLNDSHVVQMQVPVSSLADAGIVFEPISNEMTAPDRSVLADVLLGIDGRPLGIHVVTAE